MISKCGSRGDASGPLVWEYANRLAYSRVRSARLAVP